MRIGPALMLLLLPAVAIPASGCKPAKGTVRVDPRPPSVKNLDAFETAYNKYVLIDPKDAARTTYRNELLTFLVSYLDKALKSKDEDDATSALRYAVGLYTGGELRSAQAVPALAQRARGVYQMTARRGAEAPSLLALAVEQRFGPPKVRDRAIKDWKLLEDWFVRNGLAANEPVLRHEELERALTEVAAVFPSPFVVNRLADLYVARYEAAKTARRQGRAVGTVSLRRMEITGYLLLRLYLRADDFEGALAALERVELDMPVAKLREFAVEAMKARRSARSLLSLAEQFVPDREADAEQAFSVQGWGIVDNLSRRAVKAFPKDPWAHLLRARTLEHAGLTEAAIHHLRATIELKEDVLEAWQMLAALEQRNLQRLAEGDPEAAARRLPKVEQLHARAIQLWSDRPIQPGLPEAFYTVADGLYHIGEVDRAVKLLERSLGIEPVPNSLDLLGTIALKRSRLDLAEKRYQNLASMAYESELAQLRWEARARHQLGEIALRRGEPGRSTQHIRAALRHTNELLALVREGARERSDRYVERGKLLFVLGDVQLAMADFEKAADLAPQNVRAYADPLRNVVAHGYYPEARSIFRRAMAQDGLADSLKLYFCLWLRDLAQRQGVTVEPDAESFLRSYTGEKSEDGWGPKLARHARGELSFDDLLKGAGGRGERAEAYFYEALKRWPTKPDEAKTLLRKVLKTQMMGFFEYDMALSYLRWGAPPRQKRPALPRATAAKTGG